MHNARHSHVYFLDIELKDYIMAKSKFGSIILSFNAARLAESAGSAPDLALISKSSHGQSPHFVMGFVHFNVHPYLYSQDLTSFMSSCASSA